MKGLLLIVILTVLAIEASCDVKHEKRFRRNASRFQFGNPPPWFGCPCGESSHSLRLSLHDCEREKNEKDVKIAELNKVIDSLKQRLEEFAEVLMMRLESVKDESAEKPVEKFVEKEDVKDVKEEFAEKPGEKSMEEEDVTEEESAEKSVEKSVEKEDVKDVKEESAEKLVEKSVEKEDVKDVKEEFAEKPGEKSMEEEDVTEEESAEKPVEHKYDDLLIIKTDKDNNNDSDTWKLPEGGVYIRRRGDYRRR